MKIKVGDMVHIPAATQLLNQRVEENPHGGPQIHIVSWEDLVEPKKLLVIKELEKYYEVLSDGTPRLVEKNNAYKI